MKNKYLKISILVIATILFFSCNAFSQNAEIILEKNKESIVSVWSVERVYVNYTNNDNYYFVYDTTIMYGSGFFIDKEGLITTNFHVIEYIDSILIKIHDNTYYNAELIAADEKNDIAILRIINTDREFREAELGNSDEVKIGESCYTIGNPMGYEYTISQGIISGIRDNPKIEFSTGPKEFDRLIQIDAAIAPGNSGGALFNIKGEVIGITALSYDTYSNLIFCITINLLKNLNLDLVENKYMLPDSTKCKIRNNLIEKNLEYAHDLRNEIKSNRNSVQRMPGKENEIKKLDSLNNIYIQYARKIHDYCVKSNPDTILVYKELFNFYLVTEDYIKLNSLVDSIFIRYPDDTAAAKYIFANLYITAKAYKKILLEKFSINNRKDAKENPNFINIKNDSINRTNLILAEFFYNKCIKIKPDSLILYSELLDIYLKTDNIDKADKLLMSEKIIGNIDAKFLLACVYEKTENFDKAIKILKSIIAKDTDYYRAYISLGRIYYKSEKIKLAKEIMLTALKKSVRKIKTELEDNLFSSEDIYYYLGLISVKEGDKSEAILYFTILEKYSNEEKSLRLFEEIQNLIES